MAEEDKERQSRKRRRLTWDVAPSGQPEADERDGEDSEARVPPAPMLRRHVSPPKRDDDRDGHYVFSLGENLTPRYKILGKMGEGTFGRVLECWDRQTREYVAVKVVRSISKYRDAAMIEIDVLQHLSKNDKDDSHCVKMHSWFDYRNHICIVFEKLGPSLFDFLKRNKYSPFPVDLVREFGRQLLESVAYMHDLRLIHTDLKPENILLVSSEFVKLPVCKKTSDETNFRCLPKSSAIKLIDFGSTAYDNQIHSSIVSTRHYRAPEIILAFCPNSQELVITKFLEEQRNDLNGGHWSVLVKLLKDEIYVLLTYIDGSSKKRFIKNKHFNLSERTGTHGLSLSGGFVSGLGWTYPCDIWSIGCILVELCTGEALFQTHENLEHLAMMERVLGPLPEHMIRRADRGAKKYFRRSRLNWPEGAVSRESIRAVRKLDQLKNLVSRHVDSSRSSLVNLLHGLLKFDPSERLTARQALEHPFFKDPT